MNLIGKIAFYNGKCISGLYLILINKNKFDIRVIFFNKIRFIEIDKCSLFQILNNKSSTRVSMGHFKRQ